TGAIYREFTGGRGPKEISQRAVLFLDVLRELFAQKVQETVLDTGEDDHSAGLSSWLQNNLVHAEGVGDFVGEHQPLESVGEISTETFLGVASVTLFDDSARAEEPLLCFSQ